VIYTEDSHPEDETIEHYHTCTATLFAGVATNAR
jgi:hypothetical protein